MPENFPTCSTQSGQKLSPPPSLPPYRDVPGRLTVGARESEGALTDRGLLVDIAMAVLTQILLAARVLAVTWQCLAGYTILHKMQGEVMQWG